MAGSILITIAFALSLFSMVMYYLTFRGAKNTLTHARLSFHAMVMLVIIASAYLLYLILSHQYQYLYVYSYSGSTLPLGFLISTFWAGQEGSFLLWLLMTALVGVFLQSYTSKRDDLEPRVMAVFALSTTFLLAMVSPLLKNPFAYIWSEPSFIDIKNINQALLSLPALQSFMFSDPASGDNFVKVSSELNAALQAAGLTMGQLITQGKGLNPLLQNFWMQIHPPILFVGFSMATVPFTFAIAALMKNDYRDWVKQSFPWTLAGAGILGLGIMLGGYWAYGVLGWGGYWAWDPVENSSLVPWLVSVAAIHTMLVQRKEQRAGKAIGRFGRVNLMLSVMVYVLVIYSTFLTRSGILGDASVHSFVDPGMSVYIFLVFFVLTFLLLGAGLIIYRWKSLEEPREGEEDILSRELALFTAAVTVGASALIVLVGTSAPIFKQSVQTNFYNEMHVPLAIIVGLLNGISLLLKWKQTKGEEILKKSQFSIIATLAATVLTVFWGGVYDVMMILMALSAYFTLFVNGEIAYKIVKGNLRMLGAYLTHMGFAIFILGVIASSAYSVQKDVDLTKGVPVELFGYKMQFTGYRPTEDNKYAFNINVKKGDTEFNVEPVMYISDFNDGMMREPYVLEGFVKDFYVSPLGYDDGSQSAPQGNSLTLTVNEETRILGASIKYAEFIKPDMGAMMQGGSFTMGAKLSVEKDGKKYERQVLMTSSGGQPMFVPAEVKELNMRIELTKIDPASKNADIIVGPLTVDQAAFVPKETLSVTASVKPFVSLVWLGVLVLVIGFFVATYRRLKESWA